MRNQILGSVKINAKGRDLYGFINAVHERRISCFKQYVKRDSFCAEIYRSDLKRLEDIAEKYSIEIS